NLMLLVCTSKLYLMNTHHSYLALSDILIFFFFQAEDGIRDRNVTGVQTCALPIYQSLSNYLERTQSLHEVHLSKRFYFFLVNVVLPKYDEHSRYAPLQLINHDFYKFHHSMI